MGQGKYWLLKVEERGRITFPPDLLESLGVRPGDRLFIRIEDPRTIVLWHEPKEVAAAGDADRR